MGSLQNQKDDKRDAKRSRSIFKPTERGSTSDHGVNLLTQFNPEYLTSIVKHILQAGGSPTFTSSKDGNAVRLNIYWDGAVNQGEWCASRTDFDRTYTVIEEWLSEVVQFKVGSVPRWKSDQADAAWQGAD